MQAPLPIREEPRSRCACLLLVLVLLTAFGKPALAWSAERTPVEKRLVVQPQMTPEGAAGIARRETGGRVLSVTALRGDAHGYRVRLLLDGGRVTTVLVDPRGRVSRPH